MVEKEEEGAQQEVEKAAQVGLASFGAHSHTAIIFDLFVLLSSAPHVLGMFTTLRATT